MWNAVTDKMTTMMKVKNKHLCFGTTLISIVALITYAITSTYKISMDYNWPLGRNSVRYILYWDSMWEHDDYGYGYGSDIFKSCPIKNCYTTTNKNLIPLEEFDALIFHGVQFYQRLGNYPPKRNPNQVYIYHNMESQFNTPRYRFKSEIPFFNWTITFR